jgi:hypothetical protein
MDLVVRPETLAVCQLRPGQPWPEAPGDGSLFSAVSAGEERTLVCRADLAPGGARIESPWRALTVQGPLDFALVGVMAGLTAPLARAGVSVFVVSTFDTDHVLVRAEVLGDAAEALTDGGHTVTGA